MSTARAIIAGRGRLPQLLAEAAPEALLVSFQGIESEAPRASARGHMARLERLGELFEALRAAGVREVVFAGALSRADLGAAGFDARTQVLLPRIAKAMRRGDDGLLREIVAIFAEEGFETIAAPELTPDLVLAPGTVLGPEPGPAARADAERGREILATIGPLDLGQAAVVEGGLCLGIEALQGTDALLDFVARTPAHLRRPAGARGVLVKDAKPGQDLRIDMPTIGAGTLAGAKAAGLAGIMVGAGRVIVLDRAEIAREAERLGLFVAAFS